MPSWLISWSTPGRLIWCDLVATSVLALLLPLYAGDLDDETVRMLLKRGRQGARAASPGSFHFYNREDRWDVPRELYRDREIEMAPYYVLAQLPGAAKPEFLLMLPLAVYGKNQMAGWLGGLCDGANYGKMVAFRFPKGRFVDGPAQIESRINSDSRFSGDLTLWDQHALMSSAAI